MRPGRPISRQCNPIDITRACWRFPHKVRQKHRLDMTKIGLQN